MEPTIKELRIAFKELKWVMGLLDQKNNPLPLLNKEGSRKKLITLIEQAYALKEPTDHFTEKTISVVQYVCLRSTKKIKN